MHKSYSKGQWESFQRKLVQALLDPGETSDKRSFHHYLAGASTAN